MAVVCGRECLTYRELDHAANRLAHFLKRYGVGPESVVAVATGRSTRMAVAVLAVLKAGAAYLPLDPEYPHERLSFMLEDTRASVVVTEQHLLGRLPAQSARAICLDTDAELIACESDTNPETGYIEQQPRIRHLHFWFDRPAQSRDDVSSRALQPRYVSVE